MSGAMTSGVNLSNIHIEDWHLPFNLASAITEADVGKAVSLDTSAANTVKLTADNEEILGRLEVVEIRASEGLRIGTVALQGSLVLPSVNGATPALGAQVTGSATAGVVKTATTPVVGRRTLVVDRNSTANTVTVVIY